MEHIHLKTRWCANNNSLRAGTEDGWKQKITIQKQNNLDYFLGSSFIPPKR